MKAFYKIQYWNKLFNLWVSHNYKKYKTLQEAQEVVSSFKEHRLGIKFRILEIKIIKK
jgi:hypothetical protein